MPVFDFRCTSGHLTELRVSRDVVEIACGCGAKASKQSVYHFGIGGVPPPRFAVSTYLEAAHEAEYYHGRMEEASGQRIERTDTLAVAKREARKQGARVK